MNVNASAAFRRRVRWLTVIIKRPFDHWMNRSWTTVCLGPMVSLYALWLSLLAGCMMYKVINRTIWAKLICPGLAHKQMLGSCSGLGLHIFFSNVQAQLTLPSRDSGWVRAGPNYFSRHINWTVSKTPSCIKKPPEPPPPPPPPPLFPYNNNIIEDHFSVP